MKRIRIKIYLDRSRTYVGYIQLGLLFTIFLQTLNIMNVWLLTGGIIACFTIAFFGGWLDTKLKIRKKEMEDNSLENPVISEILQKVRNIDKKLK